MTQLLIVLFVIIFSLNNYSQEINRKINNIKCPDDFERKINDKNSFAYYLSNLDLKDNKTVYLFNGNKKGNQSAQFEVVKMNIGKKDLQQCADAVMRLRAEYLYNTKQYDKIHFNFLSDGKPRYYKDYCQADYSYAKFWKYMEYIFSYANTASLKKEMAKIQNFNDIEIGDVLIQSGSPYGHAVIVIDMAFNSKEEKIYLLAQSYMPAQEIHVLKNPTNIKISPWYKIEPKNEILTPEWSFIKSDLHRFKE